MSPRMTKGLALAGLYGSGIGTGWLFSLIGLPLPWMLGPLVMSAALYLGGVVSVEVPLATRPFGQMTIAAQVGLAFTPQALAAVVSYAPLLVGAAIATAVLAAGVAFLAARMGRVPLAQAFLSTFPTSPVEAAVIAGRFDWNPGAIVLTQTLRIAAVVLLVPLSVYAVDGWPDRGALVRGGELDLVGNGFLALLALAGAVSFRRLGLSNPFFLGPLAFSAIAAAAGLEPEAFPPAILSAAQVVLGTWLGSTFRRELLAGGRRLLVSVTTSTLLLLGTISACALSFATMTDLPWEVLVLGMAPGGVTEMALTAKFLNVDLAMVTALQLTRIFIFIPNMPWIIRTIDIHDRRERPRA